MFGTRNPSTRTRSRLFKIKLVCKLNLLLVTLVCFSFFTTIYLAQSQSSYVSILSHGVITYNDDQDLVLKYATDFEDAVKIADRELNLPIPHLFEFAANHQGDGDGNGGARIWVEETFAHSGNKCIGMELFDITLSRRNEFNILNIQELSGDEIFVSVWFWLPSDWELHSPTYNSYAIMTLFGQQGNPWCPYLELRIYQDIDQPIFDIGVMGRDINNEVVYYSRVENFPLPRGRWFNTKYHIVTHPTEGAVKVWMDDQLVCDISGLVLPKVTGDYKITIAKIYHELSDTTPHQLWVDDFEIWGKP